MPKLEPLIASKVKKEPESIFDIKISQLDKKVVSIRSSHKRTDCLEPINLPLMSPYTDEFDTQRRVVESVSHKQRTPSLVDEISRA